MKTINNLFVERAGVEIGLTVVRRKYNSDGKLTDYALGITIDSAKGAGLKTGSKFSALAKAIESAIGKNVIRSDVEENYDIKTLIWFELEQDEKGHFITYGTKRIDVPKFR